MFVLRSSKTHTKVDMPQIVKIESIKKISGTTKQAQAGGRFCTFTLLKDVRVHQGFTTNDEQFFIFNDGSPVLPVHLRNILKKCLKFAGFDTSVYLVHGLRSRRASDLLKWGVSVETIKIFGRWKSNVVFSYLHH